MSAHHHANLRATAEHARQANRSAFTLIEVLATLMLIAIVLPACMQGISIATAAASDARRRNDAAMLAQSKIAELITDGQWSGGILSGDFGTDWPDYRWQANVQAWPADTTDVNLQQLDVIVTWTSRGKQQTVTLSTLVYQRGETT